MSLIFQPSDLNQHGRAILDAARQGGARIRDRDGLALLVLPEERVQALESAARYASEFLALERAAPPTTPEGREAIRVSLWPWLACLGEDDLHLFVMQLRESLLAALKTGRIRQTNQLIAEWQTTAEQLSFRRHYRAQPEASDGDDVPVPLIE